MLPMPPPLGTRLLRPDALADRSHLICTAADRWPLALAAARELSRSGARVGMLLSDSPAHHPDDSEFPSFIMGDLTTTSIEDKLESIEKQIGVINSLLYLPPHAVPCPSELLNLATWRQQLHSSLDLSFTLTTSIARRCEMHQMRGTIIQTVERSAWSGAPGQVHVGCTDAALQTMNKSLSAEWARKNIRLNTIVPGPFSGDNSPVHTMAAQIGRDLSLTLPAHRLGELQEFGWAVAFLCSPYAAYITGATLVIDGGNHLRRSISGPEFLTIDQWLDPTNSKEVS